jgi:hypothetical protein
MNRFIHREVRVAWGTFRVDSGAASCPKLAWEDGTPDRQDAPVISLQ